MGIDVSLTNANDVCSPTWETVPQDAPCFISAAIERYESSTNKKGQAQIS
jgi:hypothetical protein